jgi:hypothetical protein
MIGKASYLAYGALVLGLLSAAEYRGWSMTRVARVDNVPRSIRENPGAYRPVYGGLRRYPGGK